MRRWEIRVTYVDWVERDHAVLKAAVRTDIVEAKLELVKIAARGAIPLC
jgi:hypothetical protein